MTIIAWKNGVMAADSMLSTQYGVKTGSMKKIISGKTLSGKSFIMGFSGGRQHMKAVERWLTEVGICLPPSGYTAIVAFNDERLLLVEDGGAEEIPYDAPRAAGAGAELAYGAMFAGATAVQAAQMCVEKSIYCGGEVHAAIPNGVEIKVHG